MNRRDFLAGMASGVVASGVTGGIGWFLFQSKPSTNFTPSSAGRSHYNSYARFNPVTRQITLYYNLLPMSKPKRQWKGKIVTFNYEGPDGIFNLVTDDGYTAFVMITKKPKEPEKPNLVIIPDYTLHAYNRLGGGSLYISGILWVSMDRPCMTSPYHAPGYNPLSFLDKHRIPWDLIRQSDLDFMNGVYDLKSYERLVIYGHDEYWTPNIRKQIDAAVASGVDLINLSGNTCYWGVTLNDRTINRSFLGRYYNSPDLPRESQLLGNSFVWGGYPVKRKWFKKISSKKISSEMIQQLRDKGLSIDYSDKSDYLNKFGNVRVLNTETASMAGTGLHQGDWLTDKSDILGIEIDGLPLTLDGNVDLEITKGFEPDELEIGCEGWGIYGTLNHFGFIIRSRYKKGGYVWSNSSVNWIKTLMNGNPLTQHITLNAFDTKSRKR